MRKFLMLCGGLAALLVVLTLVLWDDLVAGYEQAAALVGEAAEEAGEDMGRLSYHSLRCGKPEVMNEMQRVMEQIDQSSEIHASMRDAFYRGVEQAQAADRDYTESFCAEIEARLEQAKN